LRERSVTSEQFSCSGGTQECQEVLNPIPKQGTMPIFKLNAVMVIVSLLKTSCRAEESGLPPRKHDLISVLEQKNETSVIAQSWLFHLAQVDNTVPPGADEDGPVQPALAVLEAAPNEKLAVRKMDERVIPVGFEKRNVLNPHDPRFDIVSQENEIVTRKYGGSL
jgi:hypothetical protein